MTACHDDALACDWPADAVCEAIQGCEAVRGFDCRAGERETGHGAEMTKPSGRQGAQDGSGNGGGRGGE